MHDENLKKEFIAVLMDRTRSLEYVKDASTFLKRIQKVEDAVGKSAYAFTQEDALTLFDRMPSASRYTALHFARRYTKWCIENGVRGASYDLLRFRPEELQETREEFVANPTGLQSILDSVYDKEEEKTVSVIYRCVAWCAFSGIPYYDALALTASDVDFSRGLIRSDGVDYVLYPESVPAFRIACENTWFYYEHPNYTQKRTMRERAENDLLLRGFSATLNALNHKNRLICNIQHARDAGKTQSATNYTHLMRSGIYYRVSESETERNPVNFDKVIQDRTESKRRKSGRGYTLHDEDCTKKVEAAINRKMTDEYYRWKLAFLPV